MSASKRGCDWLAGNHIDGQGSHICSACAADSRRRVGFRQGGLVHHGIGGRIDVLRGQ